MAPRQGEDAQHCLASWPHVHIGRLWCDAWACACVAGGGAAPVLPPQPRPRKASRLQSNEISPMPQLDAQLSAEDDGTC